MLNDELLHCPCCGSTDLKVKSRMLHTAEGWFAICQCNTCGITKQVINETKAVVEEELKTCWNTRKPIENIVDSVRNYYDGIAELGGSFLPEVVIDIIKNGGGLDE